jgi:hypothetical protein
MREEDLLEIGQPDRRAHQLALRPLATVEEQSLTAPADEDRRRRPTCRRRAARRAEKDEVKIHAPIVAKRRAP